MKKLSLTALLVLGLFVAAKAQDSPLRFGAKAGINLTDMRLSEGGLSADTWMGLGLQLGVMMEYSFNTSFAVQPALQYMGNKAKLDVATELGVLPSTFSYGQLQLPVDLKYTFGSEPFNFFITAGPYVGYLMSAKMTILGTSADLFDEELFGRILKRVNAGFGFGIGIEINRKLNIGLGCQLGLANLSLDDSSWKLSTYQLSVGYFF